MSCKLTQRFVPGYLDGELDSTRLFAVEQHLQGCSVCSGEVAILRNRAAFVRDGLDRLPKLPDADTSARAWSAFQKKREEWMDGDQNRWTLWQKLSLAGGCLGVAAVTLVRKKLAIPKGLFPMTFLTQTCLAKLSVCRSFTQLSTLSRTRFEPWWRRLWQRNTEDHGGIKCQNASANHRTAAWMKTLSLDGTAHEEHPKSTIVTLEIFLPLL